MRLLRKILLVIITFGIVLLLGFFLFQISKTEYFELKFQFYVGFIYFTLGVFSLIYHLKTFSLYKKRKFNISVYNKNKSLRVLNLLFGIVVIITTLYIESKMGRGIIDYVFFFAFTMLPIIMGVWFLLEERFLYRKVKRIKTQSKVDDSIDDIGKSN